MDFQDEPCTHIPTPVIPMWIKIQNTHQKQENKLFIPEKYDFFMINTRQIKHAISGHFY